MTTIDGARSATDEFLVKAGRFFTPGTGVARPAHGHEDRWPRGRHLLPRPLEPRQGRAHHPRRELHGVVLVEGVRQGRHHHLGDAADRLPVRRPRQPRVRAARLPPRRRLLLVHLLAHARPLPVRARRAARGVPHGEAHAPGPGRRLGLGRRRPRDAPALPACARQGRARARLVGRGPGDHRRRPRAHDQEARTGPRLRVLAHPGDVDGLARGRRPLHQPDRRLDAVVLRLVRRPAGRVAAGVRRPDRRPRVGRLVERRLPDHVGLQRPGDPHARRALHDRGPLPRPEGRHGRRRTTPTTPSSPTSGWPRTPAPTARWRWPWATSSSRSSSSSGRCRGSSTTSRSTPTCPSSSA